MDDKKEDVTKITTKTWYGCGDCKEKLTIMSLGGGGDIFGLMSTTKTAMYCENKECDKYGTLTIVGIKHEE